MKRKIKINGFKYMMLVFVFVSINTSCKNEGNGKIKSLKEWANLDINWEMRESLKIKRPTIEWVDIPAGSIKLEKFYNNGDLIKSKSDNTIEVKIGALKMSKYEVTFEQFKAFCISEGVRIPEEHGRMSEKKVYNLPYDNNWGYGNQPAINITPSLARKFALWMGCRLPTHAEWEYACRAGTSTPFNTGKCLSSSQANFYGEEYSSLNCGKEIYRGHPIPVGSFAPNAWGLYDMHGNVYEYCEDIINGDCAVIRGGGYNTPAEDCKSSEYWWVPFNKYADFVGIRLVYDSLSVVNQHGSN
jgi:sulfatase modifying factor 1